MTIEKNKCPAEEIINRYLDGELDPASSSRVDEHLEACPRCRAAAERLRRSGDFLFRAAAGRTPPPARLDRMIREKFFPSSPEVFLGVLEFELAAVSPRPALGQAAERPGEYAAGPGAECRGLLAGEGIEAAVELFRGGEGAAACRVAVRDRTGRPLAGARLRLEKEGKTVWSFLTRGEEEPVIPRLLPGSYRLRIEHGRNYGLVLDLR